MGLHVFFILGLYLTIISFSLKLGPVGICSAIGSVLMASICAAQAAFISFQRSPVYPLDKFLLRPLTTFAALFVFSFAAWMAWMELFRNSE